MKTRAIKKDFRRSKKSFRHPGRKKKGIDRIKKAEEKFKATLEQRLKLALKKAKAAPQSQALFEQVKNLNDKLVTRGNYSFDELTLIDEVRKFILEAQKIHG